jgi:hypothetical protein
MLHDDISAIRTSIDPRRGIVRIIVSASSDSGQNEWQGELSGTHDDGAHSSEVIFEKLPADIWAQASPSVVSDPLSEGIKKAYDPLNILNPGILG